MYIDSEIQKYKYDAFISYRHSDIDQFIAEKIQKYLEEFKLPKNLKNNKQLKRTKIERVFRDKEELTITNNLADKSLQYLSQDRIKDALIYICCFTSEQ